MNKKLFLGMFAAAGMLFATSCSNDELDVVQSGNEAQVTFSLAAEGGIATRAISDGTGADLLYYAIFDADGKLITTINGSTAGLLKKESAFPSGSKEDNVEVTLAKGQEYTAVFWAQDKDCQAYTVTAETDGLKVAVDYEGDNNDETRDAFFKAETFKVTGNTEIDVVLKRPFAQINVGVTEADWKAAVESGIEITESKVVIKNAATSINLLDGTVSGEEEVTYDFATIPAKFTTAETLAVDVNHDGTIQDDEKYKYLSMSYILTDNDAERTTLEADGLQFTFSPENGEDIVFDKGLHAVPVQRNWRTNILGKLLTGDIQFNIVIDEKFDDDYNSSNFEEVTNGVKYDAATMTYYLYSVDGLQWLSTETNTKNNQFSGCTVKLTSDVDLKGAPWTPIKAFLGTFDGGNNTISNLTVNVTDDDDAAGLFASARFVKNVKLSNVNISGHYKAGAVVGDGLCARIENCHVDGGTITSTPNSKNDNANNVGGIVGYLSAEPTAFVKNSSVKNLTIKAYRCVGGIAGRILGQTASVENCVVDNVTVIADKVADYADTGKDTAAGKIVGDNMNNADLSTNTTNNVTVTIYGIDNGTATVGTADGLDYATKNGLNVSLTDDLAISANETTASSGYGATGVSVKNGSVFDGNGNTITVNDANGTWDCAINPQNGTVKNLTVNGAFRGIFMGRADGDVFIDNVVIDNVCYTFNSDGGNKNYGVYISNSTLNGWTSFSDAHKEVKFTNCKFGKGSGGYSYAFCRPYNACVFENCEFAEGYEFDTTQQTSIVFKNCTYGGVKITAENAKTLASGATKFFYNGVGSVSFQ